MVSGITGIFVYDENLKKGNAVNEQDNTVNAQDNTEAADECIFDKQTNKCLPCVPYIFKDKPKELATEDGEEIFDLNQDGVIDEEEQQLKSKYLEVSLAEIEDENGLLDNKKLAIAFDEDGDGKLNEEEKEAAQKYQAYHAEISKRLNEKFDIDGKPGLSENEKQVKKDFLIGQLEKKFDINGNGVLDPEEQTSFQSYKQGIKDKYGSNILKKIPNIFTFGLFSNNIQELKQK